MPEGHVGCPFQAEFFLCINFVRDLYPAIKKFHRPLVMDRVMLFDQDDLFFQHTDDAVPKEKGNNT